MTDDSRRADETHKFSVQPKAPETFERKSLQPLSGAPRSDPGGVGNSAQPKAPATSQSASPPPSGDD